MKYLSRILLITFVFVFSATYSHADSWRDKTELLIYSPRYFGPNAFPIPEMRDGQVSERYEVEVRGEYHYYTGDKTWDIVGRALLPFFRGRAGIEVNWCFKEKYKKRVTNALPWRRKARSNITATSLSAPFSKS